MNSTAYDENEFPYSYEEMVELSGINSLYYDDDPDYFYDPNDKILIKVMDFEPGQSITVEIRCAYIDSLVIQFLYNEYVIFILRFISTGVRTGIAARCIKEQEDIARYNGYRTIFLHAYKSKDPYVSPYSQIKYKYVGYIVWGKLGFLFHDPNQRHNYQIRFLRIARKFDPSRKMLHLLLKDHAGTKYWENRGFDWMGEYHMGPGTQSSGILKGYLRKILD